MKSITVVTPCYNEEENVRAMYEEVKRVFAGLPAYRYEHLFIDNASTDRTPDILRALAAEDHGVKVIINTRNFGPVRSPVYGLLQGRGNAVIGLACDFQDPPTMIPQFLEAWEKGAKIVLGVKAGSEENRAMYAVRSSYYSLLARMADLEVVREATGFGLFDESVIEMMRRIGDPYPFLRGLIAEIGHDMVRIPYRQPERRHGVSKINFYALYDVAFQGIVSHSKVPLRIATLTGFATAALSMLVALGYLVAKLLFWNQFSLGIAPILIGFFFLSSVQLFFVGVVGEYVGSIYTQVKNRPLVFEKERINF